MTKYVKSRRTVEHTWTCSACKSLNRGRDVMCPKCGKTKTDESYDESVKATVTDPKLVEMAHAGPNWDCAFCRFENRAGPKCVQCGADKYTGTLLAIPIPFETVDETRARAGHPRMPDGSGARMPNAVFPDAPKVEPEIPKIFVPPEPEPEQERVATQGAGYRDAAFARSEEKESASDHDDFRRTRDGKYGGKPIAAPPGSFTSWKTPPVPLHSRAAIWLTYGRDGERREPIFQMIGLGFILAAVITFMFWLFSPWHEHTRVSSATWSRQRELHHRVTLHGEGWGTPAGAFGASCESRQHGTHDCNAYDCHPHSVDCHCHQVADGESCHESCTSGGNGFSDCEEVCSTNYTTECDSCTEYDTCYEQCPTYDDWCRYSYYDWPVVATTRAGGTDRNPVTWPDMAVPDDGETYQVEQSESYHVAFTNEHGTWTTDPAGEAAFARYHSGARWDIEVTHAGTVSPIHEEQ